MFNLPFEDDSFQLRNVLNQSLLSPLAVPWGQWKVPLSTSSWNQEESFGISLQLVFLRGQIWKTSCLFKNHLKTVQPFQGGQNTMVEKRMEQTASNLQLRQRDMEWEGRN